jgi:pyrimidine deaminase RibD-like protein
VLVADGAIVGEGVTEPYGGRHGEVVALAAAGDLARGATLFVTMEPCAHHGRTPPCVDAILAAGVARVVAALITDDIVDLPAQQVGRLALPFVAPLSTDEHDGRHLTISFCTRVSNETHNEKSP